MFDPITIAAMIASAVVQQQTQAAALAKQKRMAVESQQRAIQGQNQATDLAMKRVQEFTPEKRQENQATVTDELTSKYQEAASRAPITAQGVEIGSTIPDSAGSSDYLKTKATQMTKAADANRALAALFGRIGGAGQLRRNEAVGIGDTATDIGRVGTGVQNVANIDQIGINSVQPSLGGQLLGAALGAYGQGRALGAFGSAPKMTAGAPGGFAKGSWLVGPQ